MYPPQDVSQKKISKLRKEYEGKAEIKELKQIYNPIFKGVTSQFWFIL